MVVLVTGCAGFIGYNLCKRLLKDGHTIIGVDNINDDYSVELKNSRVDELRAFDDFDFIKLDILNDGLIQLVKGKKIKYVVHLAAKDIYFDFLEHGDEKYSNFLSINVLGTSRMFELAHFLKVRKFVYSSTYSVYGKNRSRVLDERTGSLKPISPHGASKLAAEDVVHFMHNHYGVPTILLRISSVYGPGMRPFTMIPKAIDRIYRRKSIETLCDDVVRDYIYIDDVIEYILASLKSRGKYQIMNIASGKSFSMEAIGKMIGEYMGNKSKVSFVREKRDFTDVLMKSVKMSNAKARRILRYAPKVDINTGLPLTISWYLNNQDILEKSVESPRT